MIGLGPDAVALVVLIFCRIGGCLMLMPGFSSPRIPVRARLFVALSLSLALSPLLVDAVRQGVTDLGLLALVRSIAAELLVGVSIGLFGRLFFMALETMAAAIAMSVGLSANLGTPVETEEPLPALASFVTLSATILLFATDLHWEVVRGLVASYDAIPVRDGFRAQASLVRLTDLASQAFVAALRIAGPFIVFALVLNLAFGLLNKLTPQVPVYFVSAPVVLLGGIGLLYFAVKPALQIFIQAFTLWITRG
jgi:flagellar biosynthesis protein FliR